MYEDIIQQAMAEMVAGYEKIIERYLEEKDFAVFNTEIKEESVRLGAFPLRQTALRKSARCRAGTY